MATATKTQTVPGHMRPIFESLTALTDQFCKDYLTEEYAELCRSLAGSLCRKKLSPLGSGKLNSWAAGLVYALGGNNFLHDPEQDPHMRLADIGPLFGVSGSTAAAKSKQVRDLVRMKPLDSRWCLPSKLANYPFAWLIEVNGFLLDARSAPRELQVEAAGRGLIPFLPERVS